MFNGGAGGDPSGSVYNALAPIAGLDGGYLWFQGDFGERPGNNGNYFSTGVLAPMQIFGPDQALVIDSQVWIDEGRDLGGNIGLNQRWHIPEAGSIVGVNSFITWDHSQNGSFMRQFSVGAEWTTRWLKADGNFYVPWSDGLKVYGSKILTPNCLQQGHGFVFLDLVRAEQQMGGGDIEIGSAIPYAEWLSVYGGAYWWDSKIGPSISGASGRLEADLNSVLLSTSIYNDNHFGTSFNANATLLIGSGPIAITPRQKDLYAHMYDRTRRRTRVAAEQTMLTVATEAINPMTGLPYNIDVIDNTAAPGGAGTFENPFDNLADANGSTADIIFIRRGTTTEAAPLAGGTGLVLSDNQIVLGEGTAFSLPAANRPGLFCELSAAGTNPFVTANPGSDVFTLANNNTIVGVNIISQAGGNMVAANGIDGFTLRNINQNIAASSGDGGGIVLVNASGVGVIDNFRFRDNALPKNTPGAIVIQNTMAPPLDVTINNVDILGGMTGIDLRTNNGDLNATMTNIETNGSGIGLNLVATNNGNLLATANGTGFHNSMVHNMNVMANTSGDVQFAGTGLNMTGAMVDSIHTSQDNSTVRIDLANSDLGAPVDDVFDASLTNGANLIVNLSNTNGQGAGDDAFVIGLDVASNAEFNLTNGNFRDAGGDGIDANVLNGSGLTFNTDFADFHNAGGNGLNVVANNNSTFDGTFVNSSFENAMGGNGAGFTLSNNSTGNVTFNGTGANRAADNGFFFDVNTASTFNANLVNLVSLDQAGINAINGRVAGFSNATLNGDGVSGSLAGDDAIHLVVSGTSTLNMDMQNTGSFAGAGGDGLSLANSGASTALLNFHNGGVVDFSGATDNGLVTSTTGAGTTSTLNFQNGANFDGAGLDAIHLFSGASAVTTLTGPSISGANAGLDCIDLTAVTGSTTTINLTNVGSFTNPGGDALKFLASGGGTVNATITSPTTALFNSAGDQGIDGTVTGAGSKATLNLSNLDFSDAAVDGMALLADGNVATLTSTLTNLNFNNAMTGDAIRIQSHNGALVNTNANGLSGANAAVNAIDLDSLGSTNNFTLTNAGSFTTPGADAISYLATNGVMNINISADAGVGLFDNAGGDGVHGQATAGSDVTLNLTGLDFNTATGDGADIASADSTLTMNLDSDNFSGAGARGLSVVATNTTINGSSITDTTFAGAGLDGMRFLLTNSTTAAPFTMTNVDASGSGGHGLTVTANSTSDATFNLAAINLDDSMGGDALRLVANNSTLNVLGTSIRGANAANDGIHVEANNGATTNVTLNGSLRFGFAGDDAIHYIANNGTLNMNIDGSTAGDFFRAGGHAVNGNLSNSSVATVDLSNLNAVNASLNGYNIVSSDSVFTNTVTSVNFNGTLPGATNNGLWAMLDNNPNGLAGLTESTLTFTDSMLNVNELFGDGLHVDAINNTDFTLNVLQTPFSGGPFGDNQDVSADGTSTINVNIVP